MAYKIIPLTADPNQSFSITLPVNEEFVSLSFHIRWNDIAGYWIMDIYGSDGRSLVTSIPLLVSDAPAANLLAAQDYLRIGSAYLVATVQQALAQPTIDNLGTDFQLVWGDNDAAP